MLSTQTAERLFDALAAFPHLDQNERAAIYLAAEVRHPRQWAEAKEIHLNTGTLRPYTLGQACRWTTLPTASEIIAGLQYAVGALA